MINECYAGYMAFIKHKDAHRETLSPSMDNVIIFRQSFGFFQMSAIEYSPQSTEKHKMIVSNAIAPGFPELVTIKDRISPPRGMISAITLIANATIYEK